MPRTEPYRLNERTPEMAATLAAQQVNPNADTATEVLVMFYPAGGSYSVRSFPGEPFESASIDDYRASTYRDDDGNARMYLVRAGVAELVAR